MVRAASAISLTVTNGQTDPARSDHQHFSNTLHNDKMTNTKPFVIGIVVSHVFNKIHTVNELVKCFTTDRREISTQNNQSHNRD